jgi:hypothetical protein
MFPFNARLPTTNLSGPFQNEAIPIFIQFDIVRLHIRVEIAHCMNSTLNGELRGIMGEFRAYISQRNTF